MTAQNYSNHRRFVPAYHFLLSFLLFAGFVISVISLTRHMMNGKGFVTQALITLLFVCGFIGFWFNRQFPIKAQDRAIRAEESLRYFILTGKPLNNQLTVGQIAALRFASDDEFAALAAKASAENLLPDDIKKSIKSWREDHHRV